MSVNVALATILIAFALGHDDAHANTNPCNDGGVASVAMLNATTGELECYDVPPAYDGETYGDAFTRFYGFAPCFAGGVLVEDGSCVHASYFGA